MKKAAAPTAGDDAPADVDEDPADALSDVPNDPTVGLPRHEDFHDAMELRRAVDEVFNEEFSDDENATEMPFSKFRNNVASAANIQDDYDSDWEYDGKKGSKSKAKALAKVKAKAAKVSSKRKVTLSGSGKKDAPVESSEDEEEPPEGFGLWQGSSRLMTGEKFDALSKVILHYCANLAYHELTLVVQCDGQQIHASHRSATHQPLHAETSMSVIIDLSECADCCISSLSMLDL